MSMKFVRNEVYSISQGSSSTCHFARYQGTLAAMFPGKNLTDLARDDYPSAQSVLKRIKGFENDDTVYVFLACEAPSEEKGSWIFLHHADVEVLIKHKAIAHVPDFNEKNRTTLDLRTLVPWTLPDMREESYTFLVEDNKNLAIGMFSRFLMMGMPDGMPDGMSIWTLNIYPIRNFVDMNGQELFDMDQQSSYIFNVPCNEETLPKMIQSVQAVHSFKFFRIPEILEDLMRGYFTIKANLAEREIRENIGFGQLRH